MRSVQNLILELGSLDNNLFTNCATNWRENGCFLAGLHEGREPSNMAMSWVVRTDGNCEKKQLMANRRKMLS
jgi:hypothetical protein